LKLYTTPEISAPADAVVTAITTKDDVVLRVARWSSGPASRGTVAVLPGRAEFIERYYEAIADLLERRFDVVAMDWRGQGLSQRQLRDRRKGHVDDFDLYQNDLAALVENILEPFCPRPWFALGHSMAGAILIAQARAGLSPFARIVMTAPMISLAHLRFRKLTEFCIELLDLLGLGGAYVPCVRRGPVFLQSFSHPALTSDDARYQRTAELVRAAPDLAIAAPTIGWTNAAFRLMRQFADVDYPRRTLTPILAIAAGDDKLVDTSAIETFASRLKAGRCITLPHARHEILMESDAFRAQFWAAFDAFIPGVDDRLAQSVAATMNLSKRARGASRFH